MKEKRIGICGTTGHMEKFASLVNDSEKAKVVVLWDEEEEKAKQVAHSIGCDVTNDPVKLMSAYELDGVLILCENYQKAMLMKMAAENRISIFVEKPMCIDPEEAYEVQRLIKKNDVRFFMSDPFVREGFLFAKQLIEKGELGKITEAYFRLNHFRFDKEDLGPYYDKKKRQGGIMSDVGGHAIHMAHYLFGKPRSLSSVLTYNSFLAKENDMEDSAIVTMAYEDDLRVTMSASYVTRAIQYEALIYCDKGSIRIMPGGKPGTEKVFLYKNEHETEVYDSFQCKPKQHVLYFLDMLTKDISNDEVGIDPLSNSGVGIDAAVEYVQIIDAVYKAAGKSLTEV